MTPAQARLTCYAPECNEPVRSHGLCMMHYRRLLRSGLLTRPKQRGKLPRDPIRRFFELVEINPETGCWNWTGQRMKNGYCRFQLRGGVKPLAHRYSYEHFNGPIPDGMQLDHICENTRCVYPAHLKPVPGDTHAVLTAKRLAGERNRRKLEAEERAEERQRHNDEYFGPV